MSSICGTTVVSRNVTTPPITSTTIAGYTKAPRTLLIISASFSCWLAIRSRDLSSVPELSPAATSATKTSLKTFGCLASDSENETPPSTEPITWLIMRTNCLLLVCSATVRKLWVRGRPALISVESCRLNKILSFVPIRPVIFVRMLLPSSLIDIFSGDIP